MSVFLPLLQRQTFYEKFYLFDNSILCLFIFVWTKIEAKEANNDKIRNIFEFSKNFLYKTFICHYFFIQHVNKRSHNSQIELN